MGRITLNQLAPDFTLTDVSGESVTLSAFRGQKNVLLVFNRGFFWPYCRGHMAQLRRDYEKLQSANIEVVVIGPEDTAAFQDYWSKNDLPYIGLADPSLAVPKLFGQEFKLLKMGRMPAQMFLDKDGMVRFAYYGQSMRDIPRTEQLLADIAPYIPG